MVVVKGRDVVLGVDADFAAHFVWDNEAPRTSPVPVASFKVASEPCSIGDFHRFVFKEQGYSSPKWWDAVDWDILQKQKQVMPATWSLADSDDPGKLSTPQSCLLTHVEPSHPLCLSACSPCVCAILQAGLHSHTLPTIQRTSGS